MSVRAVYQKVAAATFLIFKEIARDKLTAGNRSADG